MVEEIQERGEIEMEFGKRELDSEIEDILETHGVESGISKTATIADVAKNHSDVEGEDADFALVCIYEFVTDRVEAAFRRRKKNELQPDGQHTLPGFKYLQKQYLFPNEEGESVAINIDRATKEQLQWKSSQLRLMGNGLFKHADEIDRYGMKQDH